MKVKNINGISIDTCACGSWLEHWKRFSQELIPIFCSEEKCPEKPEVGALVQKDISTDDSWYVIPLCKGHNRKTSKSLTINDNVTFVSADVNKTCGK